MKLTHRLETPDQLTEAQKEQLFQLMKDNFEKMDRQSFLQDLHEKSGVILLQNQEKEIRGFSTYLIYREPQIKARVIFSGDTIIHPDSWGSPELFYGFGSLMRQLIEERKKGEKAYWFLISKGYRTYYMLPLFFKRYWPQAGVKDSPELKKDLDILASKRFGKLYEPQKGIIKVEHDHLTEELAQIPKHKQNDPHIRLFLERNPLYTQGNELACLTEITPENVRAPAQRFVEPKAKAHRTSKKKSPKPGE